MRNFIIAAIAFLATVNAKNDKRDTDTQPNSKTDSKPEDKMRYENLRDADALSASYQKFIGWSDYWQKYTNLYIKGLDNKFLATNQR